MRSLGVYTKCLVILLCSTILLAADDDKKKENKPLQNGEEVRIVQTTIKLILKNPINYHNISYTITLRALSSRIIERSEWPVLIWY